MENWIEWIYLLLGLFVGAIASWFFAKYRSQSAQNDVSLEKRAAEERNSMLEENLNKLNAELDVERLQSGDLKSKLSAKESDNSHLENRLLEHKAEIEEIQVKFTKEFENLANRIFEEKSIKFVEQNKTKLEDVLNPLKEKIKDFEKKVEDSHKESIHRHASLHQQIVNLKELNEQMSKEAVNLTKALKGDSKAQGNWGEMILERILEKSGLTKDREYSIQESLTTSDGKRLQPDVVIHLPEDRKIVIDSKVSLVAYERLTSEEDDVKRERYLKEHILSIRSHIKMLSDKRYHELYQIQSPDFVLMFIPIESAFGAAIKAFDSLFAEAYSKNIVMVSPSTLLAMVKTIDSIWKQEYQTRNVKEIAKQAGLLYDKFVGFTEDMVKVGKYLDSGKDAHTDAMKKLSEGPGNLIRKTEQMKKLGAKTSKSLPAKLLKRSQEEAG